MADTLRGTFKLVRFVFRHLVRQEGVNNRKVIRVARMSGICVDLVFDARDL